MKIFRGISIYIQYIHICLITFPVSYQIPAADSLTSTSCVTFGGSRILPLLHPPSPFYQFFSLDVTAKKNNMTCLCILISFSCVLVFCCGLYQILAALILASLVVSSDNQSAIFLIP